MNKAYEKITIALCESLADSLMFAAPIAAAHGVTTYKGLEALLNRKGKKAHISEFINKLRAKVKEKQEGLEEDTAVKYVKPYKFRYNRETGHLENTPKDEMVLKIPKTSSAENPDEGDIPQGQLLKRAKKYGQLNKDRRAGKVSMDDIIKKMEAERKPKKPPATFDVPVFPAKKKGGS